ncbi:MAG TPA: penicillin-binding protein 1C [Deltaproteobacteria bacterium]|nr:penicillin-binding protein 1C [Deltaproteobacteria bacterium]
MRRLSVLAPVGVLLLALIGLRPPSEAWFEPQEHRRILDRSGLILAQRPVPERGHELWVELSEISPAVIDALLAAEDDRFYHHQGLDPRALARAVVANVRAGAVVQGGSTLSQQTARILAGRSGGLWGKLGEASGAVRLELYLDKDEILTWYLNRAYFGQGATGIEAAAQQTFDESAASLSVSEAATLVGLLPAPSRRHPGVDPEAARAARASVLQRMVATGRLSAADAAEAEAEPLQLRAARPEGLAPHLVARLLDEGDEPVIHTSIEGDLQRDVEALVAKRIAALRDREVDHAAVVVVHVPTSEVRAYVGSADFHAADGQVDGARASRSPGSALKPFVYGLAFERGWRPSDVIDDAPRRYATRHGSWAPINYDGGFRGPVRLREALAGSYNVPAVALLEDVGVATLQSRLEAIGLPLPKPASHYGLGLALGDGGVTLLDLTVAYAGLARQGLWRPVQLRLDGGGGARSRGDRGSARGGVRSRGDRGSVRGGYARDEPIRFLGIEAAAMVNDVLADPVARVPSFGRRTPLARPYPASVKTGTSTDFRDNWTVGYTPTWAVGVWVGNFDGRPMGDVSGVTGAGPLWAEVMDRVTGGQAERQQLPASLVRRRTCAASGGAAGPACPLTVMDLAPASGPERAPCPLHGAAPGSEPGPRIVYPAPDTVVYVDPRIPAAHQRVPLRTSIPSRGEQITWHTGGQQIASGDPGLWQPDRSGPFTIALHLDGQPIATVDVEIQGLSR